MTKKMLTISVILIQLSSCINMNDPKEQAQYIQCRSSFNPRFVSILPDRIPNNMVTISYAPAINLKEYGIPAGIQMTTRISNLSEYNDMKIYFRGKAKYIGLSTDSCLLIIRSKEHAPKPANCNTKYPIPYESAFQLNELNEKWERKTNEEIYIVDFQFGATIYSESFSTGINVNDENQTIQYWMTNW